MEKKIEQLLQLLQEYEKMKQMYLSCYELLSTLRDELRTGKYKLDDMVNFIHVTREISRLTNDLRKEADGIGHIFENVACAIYVSLNETGPIRASLATGTPDLKIGVKVPNRKKEPERFQELMDFFGVSADSFEARVIKPYWPGICERISILAEEGKPLPPGLNPEDTYPTYSMRIRTTRDIDQLVLDVKNITPLKKARHCKRKEVETLNELLTTKK